MDGAVWYVDLDAVAFADETDLAHLKQSDTAATEGREMRVRRICSWLN